MPFIRVQPYATEPIRIFYLREWNVLACSLPCSTLTARRCIQCVGLFMDDLYRASPVKQINNTLLWAEKGVMGIDAGVEIRNFVWLVAQISPWKLGFKAIPLCLFRTRRRPTTAHDTACHSPELLPLSLADGHQPLDVVHGTKKAACKEPSH